MMPQIFRAESSSAPEFSDPTIGALRLAVYHKDTLRMDRK